MYETGSCQLLFASYVRLPQDKRERIIFKENFEVIESAIEQHKRLYFTSSTNKANKHIVAPYSLSNSKEELFNYLIAQEKGNAYSFRVSRIANLAVLNEEAVFSDKVVPIFEKMEIYGPQFSYSLSENKTIKVRFSERGKALYEKIYLHRPPYTKINGDIYEFDCSVTQLTQYLQRFGKNAVVVEPENVRVDMEIYYVNAYQAYKNQGKENKTKKK